jgi:hypothetical protein
VGALLTLPRLAALPHRDVGDEEARKRVEPPRSEWNRGVPGAIQVTERAYVRLAPAFAFEERE